MTQSRVETAKALLARSFTHAVPLESLRDACDALVSAVIRGELGDPDEWTPRPDACDTLLARAAGAGAEGLVGALLAAGADPDRTAVKRCPARMRSHKTPLMEGVRHPAIVRMLLEAGADVKSVGDERRFSALHFAADTNVESVKLLLAAGADPLAKTIIGETPIDWALKRGRHDIAEVLRAAAADRKAGPALVVRRGKGWLDMRRATGVREMTAPLVFSTDDPAWAVIAVEAAADRLAGWAGTRRDVIRWERNAAARAVPYADDYAFLVGLARSRWSLLLFTRFPSSLYRHHLRLEKLAAAASRALRAEAVVFYGLTGSVFDAGKRTDRRQWNVEYHDVVQKEDAPDRRVRAVEKQLVRDMEQFFVEKGIYVPRYHDLSDGVHIRLALTRVRRDDVTRFDVLVLGAPGAATGRKRQRTTRGR